MNRLTHVLFAVALAMLSGSLAKRALFLYVILAALFSVVPDMDLRHSHRRLLHNIFAPLATSALLQYALYLLSINSQYLAISMLIGWYSHITLDLATVKGVYLFYPFTSKKVSLRICRSDSILWNTLFSVASVAIIAYYATKLLSGQLFP